MNMIMEFTFTAPLWLYTGKGAWHFMTLPKTAADEIRFFNASAKGFMPIAVKASINDTQWNTSIFPDKKSGSFIIAIKAAIRKSLHLTAGDSVTLHLKVRSDF